MKTEIQPIHKRIQVATEQALSNTRPHSLSDKRKSTLPTKLRQAQPTQKEGPNTTQNVVAKQNKKPHANKTTDDPIYMQREGRLPRLGLSQLLIRELRLFLVRSPGFEPGSSAWEADVLPN